MFPELLSPILPLIQSGNTLECHPAIARESSLEYNSKVCEPAPALLQTDIFGIHCPSQASEALPGELGGRRPVCLEGVNKQSGALSSSSMSHACLLLHSPHLVCISPWLPASRRPHPLLAQPLQCTTTTSVSHTSFGPDPRSPGETGYRSYPSV